MRGVHSTQTLSHNLQLHDQGGYPDKMSTQNYFGMAEAGGVSQHVTVLAPCVIITKKTQLFFVSFSHLQIANMVGSRENLWRGEYA